MQLSMVRWTCALITMAAACSTVMAHAQSVESYPSKPIRVVVPQPPGGTTDAVARLFAAKMTDLLKQQIVIDNRAGSGVASLSSLQLVAAANPDGYTLLAIVPSFVIAPVLAKDSRVRAEDFAPVTLMSRDPYVLSSYPGLPVKSVRELIVLARAKPGFLNMGSGNIGSGTHMMSMLFLTEAGIRKEVTYVPYKGSGVAFIDLMAGRLHLAISSIVSAGPHVKSGKLHALGVTTAQRSPEWPEVLTIAEQGVPGFEAAAWYGLVVPAKTPAAVINKFSASAAQAAKSPEVRATITALGGEPIGSTPAEFGRLLAKETPRWHNLINELGMAGTLN